MTTLAVGAALFGAVLGVRFKVLVLLPVATIGLAAIVAQGFAVSSSFSHTALSALQALIGLELGYLAGVVIRYVMQPSQASRRSTAWQQLVGPFSQ